MGAGASSSSTDSTIDVRPGKVGVNEFTNFAKGDDCRWRVVLAHWGAERKSSYQAISRLSLTPTLNASSTKGLNIQPVVTIEQRCYPQSQRVQYVHNVLKEDQGIECEDV